MTEMRFPFLLQKALAGAESVIWNIFFEKLFGFGSGNGYPPEKREVERENKKILDKVRENNLKDLTDCLQGIDPELVKGALGGRHFKELFYANAKDPKIISLRKECCWRIRYGKGRNFSRRAHGTLYRSGGGRTL